MTAARSAAFGLFLLIGSALGVAQAPQPSPAPPPPATEACAHVWADREAEFESFLRTAEVTGLKAVPVGVTRPSRAYFPPGGLAESMAWKPIPPGIRNGFYESYRSEIAAYELDKLLDLGMVPPTVERRVQGDIGAAVLWASPTRSFKELGGVPGQAGVPGPPGPRVSEWVRQLVRAKMFDNLIANKDPNLGNWLVDGDWHLILIDHSRSFTTMRSLVHKLDNIDRPLWERFQALDEATLQPAVGDWMGRSEMRAVLARRDAMRQEIDRLVKARGEAVFIQ